MWLRNQQERKPKKKGLGLKQVKLQNTTNLRNRETKFFEVTHCNVTNNEANKNIVAKDLNVNSKAHRNIILQDKDAVETVADTQTSTAKVMKVKTILK